MISPEKHEGARGGYRTVDHRDISDVYEESGESLSRNEAMVDFMAKGNIRISPEGNGINLSVAPTKAQEYAISDFISRARGEVTLDLDNTEGKTLSSTEYPKGTRSSKVINDIRNYFKEGTIPEVSDAARFRYSLRDPDGIINVNDESIGAGYGQIDYKMQATIGGEAAGHVLYSVADGIPYVNMIQTKGEYRRRGVATSLLQALQKKYEGVPINFGMTTEDGGKLLSAITEEIKNPNYSPWHAKRVMNLVGDINKLSKEHEVLRAEMRELWKKRQSRGYNRS